MLDIERITKRFSGLVALNDVSFTVNSPGIHALIGPNGAGKTTLLNIISGYYVPDGGQVLWREEDIVGLTDYEVARLGVRRTFQNLQLFDRLTVGEHIRLGQANNLSTSEAEKKLSEFGVDGLLDEAVTTLPYGAKRMVEMARAFVGDADLYLLDEPAAGLNPDEADHLGRSLTRLAKEDEILILVIDHNIELLSKIADSMIVLHHGELIAQGSPDKVLEAQDVRRAYLGSGGA